MRAHLFSPAAVLVFVVPVAALFAFPAVATPFGVRVTQFSDPTTSVAISWNSDDATENAVFFGTDAADLSQTSVVDAADTYPMPDPLGTGFSAKLTGLTPDTTYFYKVGRAAGTLYPAEALSFTTRPTDPCAPLRFVVIGDNRADVNSGAPGVSDLYEGIIAETLDFDPHLFVNTGDMVKNGDVAEEWDNMIRASEATWSRIPSITTQGNHDTGDPDGDGALYNRLFELPRNDATTTEDYYSIDIGAVHFVSLNTQHLDTTELAEMAAWFDADLAANTQPWTVVFFHKAVYTRGNHFTGEEEDADGNLGVINKVLTPLFDVHDVDLVLNGHSHDYERYVPTVGLDEAFGGTGRTFPAGDLSTIDPAAPLPDGSVGTTYIVSGGGGARTTDIPGFDDLECVDSGCTFCTGIRLGGCDGDVLDVDQEQANLVYDGSHHFIAIEIANGVLTATVQQTDTGNDPGSEVIDSFTMEKAAFFDACGAAEGEGEGEGEGEPGEGEGEPGEGEGEGEPGEGEGEQAGEGEGEAPPLGDGPAGGDDDDGPPAGCGCGALQGAPTMLAAGLALILVARRRRSR
jgi:hypothetical protein